MACRQVCNFSEDRSAQGYHWQSYDFCIATRKALSFPPYTLTTGLVALASSSLALLLSAFVGKTTCVCGLESWGHLAGNPSRDPSEYAHNVFAHLWQSCQNIPCTNCGLFFARSSMAHVHVISSIQALSCWKPLILQRSLAAFSSAPRGLSFKL